MLPREKISRRIRRMKITAAILVAALLLSVTAPFSIHISVSQNVPVLVSLDICSASVAVLSVNADTSLIQESSLKLVIPAFSGYISPSNPGYLSLMLASKQERPPEA